MRNLITLDSNIVGEIDFQNMIGQPGIGFYRLITNVKFLMRFSNPPTINTAVLNNIDAELFLKVAPKSNHLVCRLIPTDKPDYLKATEFDQNINVALEGELDRERINAIENIRSGGDLDFTLKVGMDVISRKVNSLNTRTKIDLNIQRNQSDWAKILYGMMYRKTILLEVPAHDELSDPNLSEAVKYLQSAHEQFSRGYYRDAIGKCRDSLDLLKPLFGDPRSIPTEVKNWLKRDDNLTKEQRLARVNATLIKLTHLAHHVDETSATTDWLPVDAQAVLSMTASLLTIADCSKHKT